MKTRAVAVGVLAILVPVLAFAQSAAAPACPKITATLKRGSSGAEVTSLQKYLAKDPGVYPEGQITGTYGALTEAAVKRWQIKFNVVTTGDAATTGFGAVGQKTITAIAQQCAGSSALTAPAAPNAGAMVTVSPISGTVPLSVVVRVVANTARVCGGGLYTINYGDGSIQSQISVPATNCGTVTQAFSHVYRKVGTYTVTLASGPHYATVLVTVR